MRVSSVVEIFAFHDWAFRSLLGHARGLSAAELDAEFAIGPGTVRRVLIHTYECELWWLSVARGRPALEGPADDLSLAELEGLWERLSAETRASIAGWGEQGLVAGTKYTNRAGRELSRRRLDLLLHVANHAVHHRAQCLNMLRQSGRSVPWLEYLAYRQGRAENDGAAVEWSGEVLGDLWGHAQRASGVLLAGFEAAGAEAMSAGVEMGKGSAGATWGHLVASERWWLGQLRGQAGGAYSPPGTLAERAAALTETAGELSSVLARGDEGLGRAVTAQPSGGGEIQTTVGEVALYLALHRTHHHAQLANMLRQSGKATSSLDYLALLPA